MASDPNFAWQIDVDPEGTDDGKDFDGTNSQDEDKDDDSSDEDGDTEGDDG